MKPSAIAVLLAAGLIVVTASGHTIVKTPPPIGAQADLLVEPCGCDFVNMPNMCPATYPVTPLKAGSQYQVTWTELINHAGKFRVAISSKSPETVTEADFDANVLYDGVDNNTTVPKDISTTILVPDAPCTKCTLQVRQDASDGPNPFYYSCAAITIVPGTGGAGGGAATVASGATTDAATSGTGSPVASSDGGRSPNYMPEPNASGCSVSSPFAVADDGTSNAGLAWLIPAFAAFVVAARRKR
jgi:hypothetical protein